MKKRWFVRSEEVVPHRNAKFQIFPITNSRLSASLVLNCINFLFQNFWFLIFFWKKYALQKKVYWTNFVQFWILYSDIFFLEKIPYYNYQINFQSSHLTKKETEDASKRLSSYCMGGLNFHLKIRNILELTTCPVKFGTTCPSGILLLATGSQPPRLRYLCCWLGKRTLSR